MIQGYLDIDSLEGIEVAYFFMAVCFNRWITI